jgi:hypothetical protein
MARWSMLASCSVALPSLVGSLPLGSLATSVTACRAAPAAGSLDGGPSSTLEPAVPPAPATASIAADGAARPEVQLTWRLFETQRWLEGTGRRESAIVELLINGGDPARVDLGRRDSAGCAVRGATATAITVLECPNARAEVSRAGDLELRVVAGEQGPPGATPGHSDPTLTREQTAIVRVPPGAEVVVDPELSRIPDEAPSP